ncbi:FOG: Ankyrin repeat [Plasmopara halstedii]|uniref:FOG: Ankyrin repeat n=1 Tax=Plasmopara halstedii TaxID=4781 RepID=A0A0P1ABW5_PLAHL|nr:FOG: Ankyrin repeat [Plasmopara halstedii]CEG37839.1 FOG: Ankyrin repeat [Plasmopara halstedii]|eukprot:XP_024574208.1 FOG: Ankyrin repeat [Plasmopara halstedii]
MTANMANQLAKEKEEGASEYQQQKKVVGQLLSSAENGDLEQLKITLESLQSMGVTDVKEALTDFKDAHKRTALHFAAAKGRRKVIRFILDRAPECIECRDEEGATPLLYATKENEFESVKLLLAYFADPNTTMTNGTTALHEAAANGSIRTIKLLIEHKAQLEATTKNGTPLHFAVSENREKTVAELLRLGAKVDVTNAGGVTPLMLACLMNKPIVVKELLEGGASLFLTMEGSLTALHMAAETGFTEVVKTFLLCRPEDTKEVANLVSDAGATPVQLAAGMGHHEVVTLLKPFTKGFENVDIDNFMAEEKLKLDAYYEEAAKKKESRINAAVTEPQTVEEQLEAQHQKKLAELIKDEDIAVPERTENTEEQIAEATQFKNEGNKAYLAKEYALAVDLYSQAIALTPTDAALYSNRCAAHLGADDAKQALHDVRISKKLRPDWPKALYREGQCLEKLGLYEEAACAMWAAMQLAPDDKLLKRRFQDCVKRGRSDHQAKLQSVA